MKQDFFWNTLAGVVNAAEAVVMSMIVTRLGSLADAGILTIAFAVGNLLMTIGKFGMRGFQVTDQKDAFSFRTYLKSRALTVTAMAVIAAGYALYVEQKGTYSPQECTVILLITAIYLVESVEDVIWGFFQKTGRLYVGAQMFVVRWGVILAAFLVGMMRTGSLQQALIWCFLLSLAVFVGMLGHYRYDLAEYCAIEAQRTGLSDKEGTTGGLLVQTAPLFFVSFFNLYLNNAPKYALADCVSAEMQACYGFVAMPVFVIGLLNNFIYQPMLVTLARYYDTDRTRYHAMACRQFFFIAALSLVCILGAAAIGIPVLSWLYHTDLEEYQRELVILQAAGGFLAAAGFLSALMTVLRCQRKMLAGLAVTGIGTFFLMRPAVYRYGTMGAATAFTASAALLFAAYGWLYWKERRRKI